MQAHLRQQGLHHGGARGVSHMHNAPRPVAAFARQMQVPVFLGKRYAQLLQPGNGLRRVLHHQLGGGQVAQASARHQRVVHMGCKTVFFVQHGGNAALRPTARALAQRTFADDRHTLRLGQLERGAQSGQAAAHNQYIKMLGRWRHGGAGSGG